MVDTKPEFGTIVKERPRTTEAGNVYQTLALGRLIRIGVLTIQTDADTQFDLSSPEQTVVTTRETDKGEVKRDENFGYVLWRLARVGNSSDERLNGRGVWIGWGKDEKGEFTVPLMHPDYKKPEKPPGLGL